MKHWERGLDLDWADDLVSVDRVRRRRALDRYAETERRHLDATRRLSEIWRIAGGPTPSEPHLAAAMDQAVTEVQDSYQYLFLGSVSEWYASPCRSDSRHLDHALIYLEWEAYFTADWPGNWGVKKHLLRRFAQTPDLPEYAKERLVDLVEAAIEREHRCEDQGYALVARNLADTDLRARLARATGAPDPLVGLRAAFTLYLLDHPEIPARPESWQDWLRRDDV